MKKISKIFILCALFITLFTLNGCKKRPVNTDPDDNKQEEKKDVTITYMDEDSVVFERIIKEGSIPENIEYSKDGYTFKGWYLNGVLYPFTEKVNENLTLKALFEKNEVLDPISISGKEELKDTNFGKYTIKFAEGIEKTKIEWSIDDTSIADFALINPYNCQIEALKCGEFTLKASAVIDGKTEEAFFKVKVVGIDFNLTYEVLPDDEELVKDLPTSYNTEDLPYQLPVLTKEKFYFVGWKISGYEDVYLEIPFEIKNDVTITPVWSYPHLDVSLEGDSNVISIANDYKLDVTKYDLPENLKDNEIVYNVSNSDIVELNDDVVHPLKTGYTLITCSLKDHSEIMITLGVTVVDYATMDDVVKYILDNHNDTILTKEINVIGWQKQYKHNLVASCEMFLFENLDVTENIAPLTNSNRPGNIKTKYYICVHDTGDAEYTAKQWSDTVYNEFNLQNNSAYQASYQYVVGNDGIYHNIPDNEVSWHAGDGTRVEYGLLETGVKADGKEPVTTITDDGYYALNGNKTPILAPTNNGTILKTSDINDCGIRTVIKDGYYFMGKTWYSSSYRKISNNGGNNNSIGIESCINEGTDIYLTWQRLAKLVAKLMDENDLTIDDVVPHHYFSGKDCPQTMRAAGLWNYFKDMVMVEYNMLKFAQEGYSFTIEISNPELMNSNGRIKKWTLETTTIGYNIIVKKGDTTVSIPLSVNVPGMATIIY